MPLDARYWPRGPGRHALKFFLMLEVGAARAKSNGTACDGYLGVTRVTRRSQLRLSFVEPRYHPCGGCGALSMRPRAQFSVHSVAGCPSELHTAVVPYSACTG